MAPVAPPERLSTGELIRDLSVPRLHGTPAADRVRRRIRSELERMDLDVADLPFAFSVVPGRFGAPAIGAIAAIVLPACAYFVYATLMIAAWTTLLLPAVVASVSVALSDAAILRFPFGRAEGINMLATAGDEPARFLIVAHRDSKSQSLPLMLRVTGALGVVAAWSAILAAVLARTAPSWFLIAAGGLAAGSGMLLIFCGVGNESDGALDNASGVAALLRIAWTESQRGLTDVAFLVTDAEEYGLAGARAIARRFPDVEVVINLDGLADSGPLVLIEGRAPFAAPPNQVTWTLDQCAAVHDVQLCHRGLPPGLLVDHVPFSRAGNHAFTLMRGTVHALARVHRPGDTADRLSGHGAAQIADIVSETMSALRRRSMEAGKGRVAQEPARG